MSPRNPPRLAKWLLERFRFARKNAPLKGDLLEEFRNGRSSAWYWRQTLALVFIALMRKSRNSWRRPVGAVLGWSAQLGVTFLLWRLHFPPRLPRGPARWDMMGVFLGLAVALLFLNRKLQRSSDDPAGLVASARDRFLSCLIFYFFIGAPARWEFINFQATILAIAALNGLVIPFLAWVMDGAMPRGRHRLGQ